MRVLNLASRGVDVAFYGPLEQAIVDLDPSLVVVQLELFNDSAPPGLLGPLVPVAREITLAR